MTAVHFDLLDTAGAVIPPDAAFLPPEQLTVRSPQLVDEITRAISERAMDARAGVALSSAFEEAANSMLRGLLIMLTHDTMLTAGQQATSHHAAWRQLTAHIQQHLHDRERVTELAAKAGYTRSHFSRLFTAQIGLSPQQYVINARIALAKEMLRGTTLAISDVAARAGYGDVYQFSKQFKKQTGQTPSGYRSGANR